MIKKINMSFFYPNKLISRLIFLLLLAGPIMATTGWHQFAGADSNKKPDQTQAVKYYGVNLKAHRIIFIIDTTHSMNDPLDQASKEEAKKLRNVTSEATPASGDGKAKKKKKKSRRAGESIDWSKINTKLDLAKAELIESIKSLNKETWLTVITYDLEAKPLKENLLPATKKNKKRFIRQIENLEPWGGTDGFFDALLTSLEIAMDKKKDRQIRTGKKKTEDDGGYELFFLTDGWPTINSGSQLMPEDQRAVYCEQIKKELGDEKIRINTIGIGTHDRILLKKIAVIGHQGKYVDLGMKITKRKNKESKGKK